MTELKSSEISQALSLVKRSLRETTGHSDNDSKLIACYAVGTHALPNVSIFPHLTFKGKVSTGKTTSMKNVANAAYRPSATDQFENLSKSTVATVRDQMSKYRDGTCFFEECDCSTIEKDMDMEQLFNARYSRSTERIQLKIQISEKNQSHQTETRSVFGALVMHKRESFRDPVLDGKGIILICRPNLSRDPRTYIDFDPDHPWNKEVRDILGSKTFTLPKVSHPQRVAGRVFNTWALILSIATYLDDREFDRYLSVRLLEETRKLERAQTEEPDSLVLGAVIRRVLDEGGQWIGHSRICVNDLVADLRQFQEQGEKRMTSYQVAGYARDLGFRVERSSGRLHIYPTVSTFLDACDLAGLQDDSTVQKLRDRVRPHTCKEKEEGGDTLAGYAISTTRFLDSKELAAGERQENDEEGPIQ